MVAVSLKKLFFQAEDGIRDMEGSRGLGDVYKRQLLNNGKDKTVNKSIKTCRNIDPKTETLIYK